MALRECKECGAAISKKAKVCPGCGGPCKKETSMHTWLLVIIIGTVLVVVMSDKSPPAAPAAPVVLTAEQKLAREAALVAELKGIPASDYSGNLERYSELLVLAPDNKRYAGKVAHYMAVKDRQARIDYQFDWGDGGSHKNLRAHIVKNLKDPGSFEHIESIYNDKGDYIVVQMTYRARNSFGGFAVEAVKARCTIAGKCTVL